MIGLKRIRSYRIEKIGIGKPKFGKAFNEKERIEKDMIGKD